MKNVTNKNTKIDKPKDQQLSLGLKEPFFNRFLNIRRRFVLWLAYIETKKYFRTPLTWLFIIPSISAIVLQIILIYFNFGKLPQYIPLTILNNLLQDRLQSSIQILILPILSLLITIIFINFTIKTYYREKLLSYFNLFFMFISDAGLTFALVKIIAQFYVK